MEARSKKRFAADASKPETVQIERALDPEGLRRQFRQTGKGV